MAEFGVLLAARWRMLRAAFRYWLLAVGYDAEVGGLLNRLYAVYLVLALGGLGLLAWLETLDAASLAYRTFAAVPATHALPVALLGLLPVVVALIQLAGIALAWWMSPLRLTWPEIAYVAGAPIPAAAIVAVAFLRVAALAIPIAAALAALAAVILTGSDRTSLGASEVAIAVAVTTMGLNWLAGMTRLAVERLRHRRWLAAAVALLLLGAGASLPAAGLWPGRLLSWAIGGSSSWPGVASLAAVGLALAAGAIAVGARISLTDVVDESGVYARLATFAPGDRRDPAALARVRAEAHVGPRRVRIRLPDASGAAMLAVRAGLGRLRRPSQVLFLIEDVALALSACWMLADPRLPHPWFAWLIIMVAVPPRGLGDAFLADVEAPSLRQMLPASDLMILVADEGVPFLLLAGIGIAIWLAARPPAGGAVLGTLLIPVLMALRAACRGFAARVRLGARVALPFAPVAAVGFGLVLLLGVVAGAPWAALALAAAFCVGMGSVLAHSW